MAKSPRTRAAKPAAKPPVTPPAASAAASAVVASASTSVAAATPAVTATTPAVTAQVPPVPLPVDPNAPANHLVVQLEEAATPIAPAVTAPVAADVDQQSKPAAESQQEPERRSFSVTRDVLFDDFLFKPGDDSHPILTQAQHQQLHEVGAIELPWEEGEPADG